MATSTPRTEKLDLRITLAAKQALAAAAAADNRSLSEFVLDSALRRAEETLSMRRHFGLDAERWVEFLSALDAEPRELPRVRALFDSPGPFDGGAAA